MKTTALTAIALCLTTSFPLHAATERDLDSHVHGGASLNLVAENNTLYAEFESPWVNLVGFEHEPSTDDQRSAIAEAIAGLQQGDSLFVFAGTQCELQEAVVESSMDDEHDEDHDADHDEHGDEHAAAEHDEHDEDHEATEHDEHDEDHEATEHDEHDEDHETAEHDEHHDDEHHDEHEGEGSAHSEVVASYVFECADLSNLDSIDVELQSIWTGIEDLDVQLVGPQGQSAMELEADAKTVDMSSVL